LLSSFGFFHFASLSSLSQTPNAEPIMVALQDTVQYAGQSIAIVLAATQAQADAAALLVIATYTNQLPPILTIADARANPSRGILNVGTAPLVAGNVQNAFQTATNLVQVSRSPLLLFYNLTRQGTY
jgi:xanthine dehydrogenase molybdopterin-binding subunit B